MTGQVRRSRRTRRVLLALLTGAEGLSGRKIGRLTGLTGPGVYSVLDRLEDAGWAEGNWRGEPRSRFYQLTPEGRGLALALLELTVAAEGK